MATLIKWWLIIVAAERIIGMVIGLIFFSIIVLVAVAQVIEKRKDREAHGRRKEF